MKKLFYTVISLILLQISIHAKETYKGKEAYITKSQKIYGGKENDIANDIVALENGESAIVGTCKSYNAKRRDICVTRMNAKGDMDWRLWLGGDKQDYGKAITRAADGNLFILGKSKSFSENYDYDLYVAKISLDGKLMWKQHLGGKRDESAGGIAGTDDGGVIVVGDSESFGDGNKNIYISKLNSNGKVISEKTIGGEKADSAKAISRTKDNMFIVVGDRELGRSGDTDFFLMKIDQNGQKVWAKTYGEDEADTLLAVTATMDGGFVATGKTRSYGSKQTDLTVIKFDENGKVIWHKIYGFKYYEYGNAVTMTRDGGFIIAGGTDTLGRGNHSAYIIALDKLGNLIWSHVYGDERKDIAHGATLMSDGSVVIVGESESFSRSKNFFIIKIQPNKI